MNNQIFEELIPEQKRIMIATDIIAQIYAKTYKMEFGDYINSLKLKSSVRLEDDFKQKGNNVKNCNVCAIGAMVLSATNLFNELKYKDINHTENNTSLNSNTSNFLLKFFSERDYTIMENIFEGYNYYDEEELLGHENPDDFTYAPTGIRAFKYDLSFDEIKDCIKFKTRYKSPKDIMIALMQNIINNNGSINLKF